VRRRDGELRSITGCRVEQTVGPVELYIGRQANQLVTLRALAADIGELGDICFFNQEGEPAGQPAVDPALVSREEQFV
jgi:hypothetical protein